MSDTPDNESRPRGLELLQRYESTAIGGRFRTVVVCAALFDFLDKLRADGFPGDWLDRLAANQEKLAASLDGLESLLDVEEAPWNSAMDCDGDSSAAAKTGEVYFQLWKDFSKEEYFQQAARLLKLRLERNSLSLDGVENALDGGCGGGRYTLALRSLGVPSIVGLDVSPNSVAFAQSKSPFPESEVRFKQGSALELPFDDGAFDFVFSNGVLHHTTDVRKGLAEVSRVLKPGGSCWLYLYGGKESFFWDVVDVCRKLLVDVPQDCAQAVMRALGYPAGRVFHRADFWYVPINERYFEVETVEMIEEAGFRTHRRLRRGSDHDWDEIIDQNPDIDPYVYGEGEMRFWLGK